MNPALRTLAIGVARGVAIGVLIAAAIAAGVTLWELVENPGGIFRTAEGWRWDFLAETAWSWFLPTVLAWVPVCVLLTLLWRWRSARSR